MTAAAEEDMVVEDTVAAEEDMVVEEEEDTAAEVEEDSEAEAVAVHGNHMNGKNIMHAKEFSMKNGTSAILLQLFVIKFHLIHSIKLMLVLYNARSYL